MGLTRGAVLQPDCDPADGPGRDRTAYYIGIGTVEMGRRDIFTGGSGVAVALTERVFQAPPFPGVFPAAIIDSHPLLCAAILPG